MHTIKLQGSDDLGKPKETMHSVKLGEPAKPAAPNDPPQDPPAPKDPPANDPPAPVEPQIKEVIKEVVPEALKPLNDFLKETGGTVQDFVKLNTDIESIGEEQRIRSYYEATKSHLSSEDIDYLMNDQFTYDEEVDDEDAIKKKKLFLKEELAKATSYHKDQKDKWYKDITMEKELAPEVKEAISFYDQHKTNQTAASEAQLKFQNDTKEFFSQDKFKGFEFKLGEDNSVTYTPGNIDKIAESNMNINNFTSKYLDDNGNVTDVAGYNKAIWAAENADAIAKHFYEQGKADAIKGVVKDSKNITDEGVRKSASGAVFVNGMKVTAVSGSDSTKLRIKR